MKNPLRAIKNILRKDRNIEFAYLFGSQATGAAGPGSDWDIAVFYADSRNAPRWRRFYLEAELSRVLGGKVQVTVLNNLGSPLFIFEVIEKGILLVDRNAGRRVAFEARQIASYHDWQYFQDRLTAL